MKELKGKEVDELKGQIINLQQQVDNLTEEIHVLRSHCCDMEEDRRREKLQVRAIKFTSGTESGKHFVDEHRLQLIRRVFNIDPILDEMLHCKIIQEEIYDYIRSRPTTQEKMRQIYSGPLKSGRHCKDVFLRILMRNQKFLIQDLEGAAGEPPAAPPPDKHFVDKHRLQLIRRVSNIDPILDEMLHEIIPEETYDSIQSRPTTQEKMRQIYSGPLKSGRHCKDVFFKILMRNQKFLIQDLEGAAGEPPAAPPPDKHFVDKHRLQLIRRVSNIDPILDEMLHEIIPEETYDSIQSRPTTQEKMRQIYSGPLKSGRHCKDVFFKILMRNQKFLIQDLSMNHTSM